MAEPSSGRVRFSDSYAADSKSRHKQPPTQKYDRKEIQKRLEIEDWMERQLSDLFDCQDESADYPQLDIDDVIKIDPGLREDRLREYLKDAKKPIEAFIKDLLEKAQGVKPVSSS